MIMGLPEKLKDFRQKYGFSQKQVADKVGVSPSIISSYETGERTPSITAILALSHLYNCSVDYLLGKTTHNPDEFRIDISGLSGRQIKAIVELIDSIKQADF